ncbi:unnamed protein product [Victoria cruziana]
MGAPLSMGKFGPFGLLLLASKGLQEHAPVFRIYKDRKDNYAVFMCRDRRRSSKGADVKKTTNEAKVNVDPEDGKPPLRVLVNEYTFKLASE